MGILKCYDTSLDFVNVSASVISRRVFLLYNGPGWGHLYVNLKLLRYFHENKRNMQEDIGCKRIFL